MATDLKGFQTKPDVMKQSRMRPDLVLHSEATKQLIMTKLIVPFEFNMEEHHQLKLAKYDDVAQELRSTGTIS